MSIKLLKATIVSPVTGASLTIPFPWLTDFFSRTEPDPFERICKLVFLDVSGFLQSSRGYSKDLADVSALLVAEKLFKDARFFWDPVYAANLTARTAMDFEATDAKSKVLRSPLVNTLPLLVTVNKHRKIA